jgi:hypothetical protein
MVDESGLINQPTPEAIVPQVVLTPLQPAADGTPQQVPTVQSNGNRSRNNDKGMAPVAPTEHADTKPIVVGSAADSGSAKVLSLPTPAPSSSESVPEESNSNYGRLDRTSNPTEGVPSSSGFELTREAEAQLVERIGKLWSSHNKKSSSVKQSREELMRVRDSLAEQLHTYKALLVGTGRDGRWAPFLKDRGIPVKTADRYVKHHVASLLPVDKKLDIGQLPPTAVEVSERVKKLAPGLIRFLTTPESISQFMQELGAALRSSTPSP